MPSRARLVLLAVTTVLSASCGDPGPEDNGLEGDGTGVPLISFTEPWEFLTAGQDPFAAHRPAHAACNGYGFKNSPDGSRVEIHTGGNCSYVSARQALRTPLRDGDKIRIQLWHNALISTTAAEAHAAVWIDGRLVWETRVPLPAIPEFVSASVINETVTLTHDVPHGHPVVFHLHNHGQNDWTLREIAVVRQ